MKDFSNLERGPSEIVGILMIQKNNFGVVFFSWWF